MGYQLSIVTGIPNFYERVGYSFAFPSDAHDPAVLLNLDHSRQPRALPHCSRFEMSDLPVLEHLCQIANVARTGTLVRNHGYWGDWWGGAQAEQSVVT